MLTPEKIEAYHRDGYIGVENGLTPKEVKGNYHRRKNHRLNSPLDTKELRVEVMSIHDTDTVRIYELRAY